MFGLYESDGHQKTPPEETQRNVGWTEYDTRPYEIESRGLGGNDLRPRKLKDTAGGG